MALEHELSFFVVPEEMHDKELSMVEMEKYKVSPETVQPAAFLEVCGTYSQAHQCGSPPHTKYGNCTKYCNSQTGAYSHTECESAFTVCARP